MDKYQELREMIISEIIYLKDIRKVYIYQKDIYLSEGYSEGFRKE